MQSASVLAGYTLGEADLLRRAWRRKRSVVWVGIWSLRRSTGPLR